MDNQHQQIKGYRDLSQTEIALMNEGKHLAELCGAYIEKLRRYPRTPPFAAPIIDSAGRPQLDQRWVSIGATHLQEGFMCVIRGIAQPTTF